MNQSYFSPRLLAGAAIVGLVGAAGVFIYEQVYAEKRRAMLVSEVARLDRQLASLQTELVALRDLQRETKMTNRANTSAVSKNRDLGEHGIARRPLRKARVRRDVAPAGDATDSEYFTDCQSLIGTDIEMDSEEFYDVPSDEDDSTLRESVSNGIAAIDDLDDSTEKKIEDTKAKVNST
ncbi:uncharacterized protein LOC121726756 isoform X1 [Aricia agestis]|uniref:uncharacterized protein LOC121726756 isoform X1 n=1 Tax=Aricia agestis TaxID=91739 RepID=UPI001C20AFEA|nr:uncharacterized protein LOC121726756 isoform X1 [Aricia agestis]